MAFIVAIDGPAGSGKGTITKIVGQKMNLLNIDTGAMYRCITLAMLNNNIGVEELNKIEILLKNIKIEMKYKDGEIQVFLNGLDVTKDIRTKEVNEFVSPVSAIKIVRDSMSSLQRDMAKTTDVIMEGRDIGTVVFPNADVKIYLDATAEERANRRFKQNTESGIDIPYDEILKNVKERDYKDSHREISPLKQAEDAIYIDSTNLSIEEVCDKIIDIIKEVKEKNN